MNRTAESNPSSDRPEGSGIQKSQVAGNGKSGNGATSASQTVLTFIQENPVVAAGGAFAAGAAIAMIVRSQRAQSNRLDRRVARLARKMDQSFSREMRNLRHSDFAERAGRVGSSFGDALSRIDLSPLAERGQAYLDAIAGRMKR